MHFIKTLTPACLLFAAFSAGVGRAGDIKGKVTAQGGPADPGRHDYQRAARDALHFAALFDRLIQNLRRFLDSVVPAAEVVSRTRFGRRLPRSPRVGALPDVRPRTSRRPSTRS